MSRSHAMRGRLLLDLPETFSKPLQYGGPLRHGESNTKPSNGGLGLLTYSPKYERTEKWHRQTPVAWNENQAEHDNNNNGRMLRADDQQQHVDQEYYCRVNQQPGQITPNKYETMKKIKNNKPNHEKKTRPSINLPDLVVNKYLKQTSSTSSAEAIKDLRTVPTFVRSRHKAAARTNSGDVLTRNRFQIIKELGEGKFGSVCMVQEIQSGFLMAMKVIKKSVIVKENFLVQLTRELKIQSFLDHPNIIKIYGFFCDEANLYILMELGCDGQLYDFVSNKKTLTQEGVSIVAKNLLEAANEMHSLKVLHRDIKPENIVLIWGNVKICDFGWAVNKQTNLQLRTTFCGTPLYLSPQVLKGCHYDEKVDLWAIGMLTYELMFGRLPFEINMHQDLLKIIEQRIEIPKNRQVSRQFQHFLQCILNKNPHERFSCSQLLQLQFIKRYDEMQVAEELCK